MGLNLVFNALIFIAETISTIKRGMQALAEVTSVILEFSEVDSMSCLPLLLTGLQGFGFRIGTSLPRASSRCLIGVDG